MPNYYTLLTTIGAAQLVNAQALSVPLNLTEIAAGDGLAGAVYDPIESQAALKNEVWRGAINTIYQHADNANWLVIEGIIPTAVGGWFIREVGVFDENGNMFAIAKVPETYKPLLAEGSTRDMFLRVILEVSNADQITLQIDPGVVLASQAWVLQAIQNNVPVATETVQGKVELATVAEALAGSDTGRAVTPAGLSAVEAKILADQRKKDLLQDLLAAMQEGAPGLVLNAAPDPLVDLSRVDTVASANYVHIPAGSYLHNPPEVTTDLATSIADWNGQTGNFTLNPDGSIDGAALGDNVFRAMRRNETFTGDFSIEWQWSTGDGLGEAVGLYDATGDASFSGTGHTGSIFWTSVNPGVLGWAIMRDLGGGNDYVLYAPDGGAVTQTQGLIGNIEDAVLRLTRVGDTVKFYIDDVETYTFPITFAGDVRLLIAGTNNTASAWDYLDLITPAAAGDCEVIWLATEAFAIPVTGYLLAIVEPVDAVVYGVDVLVDMSIDDGGTWDAGIVEKIGETDDGYDVIFAEAAFSIGGDQTVRARLRFINDKHVKLHGIVPDAE